MPSTGPLLPQKLPQMTRTRVPSSSVHFRDVASRDILVTRRRHLQRGRQVRPELEAVHASVRIALRHLLVDDAAAGRHPLHVAGAERAAIAEAVAVLDRAGEHVGDRLDPAMRMPRKPGSYSRGLSLRKSSKSRNGSNSVVSPKPNARRSFTPAPSVVGCDWVMRLTARMDIEHRGGLLVSIVPLDQQSEGDDTAPRDRDS